MVKYLVEEQRHSITEKGIILSTRFSIHDVDIDTDPELLRMVFQNILSNAIKYTPEHGLVTLALASEDKRSIVMTCTDTGYGIPDESKDAIYTKMFRADNVKALDTEGTGLGLYIVKLIMNILGGTISFTSTINKGTTFRITLDCKDTI